MIWKTAMILIFSWASFGCADGKVSTGSGDGDSDADTDTANDTDTDTGTDKDTDTGTDTDTETDTETGNGEPELCNNIDDDEDGQTDEDIVGGEDIYEPNQSCSSPEDMGTVEEDSLVQTWSANVYPEGDYDVYRFYVVEGDHSCVPLTSQDFYAGVTLTPPDGEDCVDLDLFVYDDSCTLIDFSQTDGCVAEGVEIYWEGTCTLDDSRYLRVEARPRTGEFDCAEYQLSMDMWMD